MASRSAEDTLLAASSSNLDISPSEVYFQGRHHSPCENIFGFTLEHVCGNSRPDLRKEQEQQQSGVGLDHRTVFLHNPTAAQETDKGNAGTCAHGIVASLGVLVLGEFRIMVQLALHEPT